MDLQKSEMPNIKNNEQLYFETVFIVDDDNEEVNSKSSSSSSRVMNMSECPAAINSVNKEFLWPGFRNSNEEFIVLQPSNSLSSNICIQEPRDHSSAENLNSLDEKQGYSWANEKPLGSRGVQSNYIFKGKSKQDNPELTSLTSFSDAKGKEPFKSSFNEKNKDQMFKRKNKFLKTQQKVERLNKKLTKLNEEISYAKKVVPNTFPTSNVNPNNFSSDTLTSLSSPNPKESTKTYTQVDKLKNKKDKQIKTLNKQLNDSSKEFNIDFLKGQIVGASQTLIKTEKSLKLMRKFLHSDVLVEKETAAKHLKDFQYTINTFRKAIKEMDRRVLTHYRHIVPNIISDQFGVCDDIFTNHELDSQKAKENIIEFQNFLDSYRQFEVIIPSQTGQDVSESLDCANDRFFKPKAVHPDLVSVKSEQQKIKNVDSKCPKIKTRIISGNWKTGVEKKNENNGNFHSEECSQSNNNVALTNLPSDTVIILD